MSAVGEDRRHTRLAFAAVTLLFFAWGFITANNDPLLVALRSAFSLSYTEALLTQIIFFLGFGMVSLPAAWLSSRIGPADTILVAVGLMMGGCLLVSLVTSLGAFPPVLAALFVIAAGYTSLQVAANPLAAALGPAHRSHFRLNLAQALNSIGVVAGVQFGSQVMLGGVGEMEPGSRGNILEAVDRAFLLMAALLALLWLLMLGFRRLLANAGANAEVLAPTTMFEALRSRWAMFGAVAIGLYVGAEVSIGSIMINFLNQSHVLGLPFDEAGRYLAGFYWGGALVGRLLGTLMLARLRAKRLLAACAVAAVILCSIVLIAPGSLAGYAALGVGLFNSIMFPTIFSITLERSGISRSATSGLLCMAIFGGALLPLSVGATADHFGVSAAFAVPAAAYAYIALFAFAARRPQMPATTRSSAPLPAEPLA